MLFCNDPRLERLQIRTLSGKAKVAGKVVGLGDAMLLNAYKGPEVVIWTSKVNLLREHGNPGLEHLEHGNRVMGSLLAVGSCFCYSIWFIVQVILRRLTTSHHFALYGASDIDLLSLSCCCPSSLCLGLKQAKMSRSYPVIYSSTALMCTM